MKSIRVPLLPHFTNNRALDALATAMDGLETHLIDIAPWPAFANKPDVSFKIAHGGDCIFLKYSVTEPEIRIVYQKSNDPVYKDSCVEFFVSLGAGEPYYNFEFNPIGTCLAAFGENRHNRQYLPAATIAQIQTSTSLQTNYNQLLQKAISWNLTIKIPITVFSHYQLMSLDNRQCFGNFYKCGDELKSPHYVVWNPITAPQPDFHLSQFFGSIHFD